MDLYNLDRTVLYQGIAYRIVEILSSGTLLVVEKEVFDAGIYPMPTMLIPGK